MNFTLSYNDDKNTKRSINPKDICKSTKNFFEKTNTREDISKTTMSEVLIKKKKKKFEAIVMKLRFQNKKLLNQLAPKQITNLQTMIT